MKKRIIGTILALTALFSVNISAEAEEDDGLGVYVWEPVYWDEAENDMHHELDSQGYFIDDGYDLIYEFDEYDSTEQTACWWKEEGDEKGTISLCFKDLSFVPWNADTMASCARLTVRIPNTVNGVTVSKFYKSGAFTAFDVDAKNKYIKSDGRAVFTKDGKTLLSYAQYAPDKQYQIPEGTETVGDSAFSSCSRIEKLYIPESVTKIEQWSLSQMDSLKKIIFNDFNVSIDKTAFSNPYFKDDETDTELICTKTVHLKARGKQISWKPIDGDIRYEIYQKLNNGEYKLLKTTKATACKFTTLKNGKSYTFAVKPVAVIPAANYNKERYEGYYPESFKIEGTMSEDISVRG